MKAFSKIIGAPLKALGLVPKMPKPPEPTKAVTRDDARERAEREDELRKRTGQGADIVTGAAGAEAGATSKTKLG